MKNSIFTYQSQIDASAQDVFDWHCRLGALERLQPPWVTVEVVAREGDVESCGSVELRMKIGLFKKRWLAKHTHFDRENLWFRDIQEKGPFAFFEHTHTVKPLGESTCALEDHIEYVLPFGALGRWLAGRAVPKKFTRMFSYRHRITRHDVQWHAAYSQTPQRVLISGSHGLVGSALVNFLRTGGHDVVRLVRAGGSTAADEIAWNAETGEIDISLLEGFDAVIHLAGESLVSGRWNEAKKATIRESRVRGSQRLCENLARLQNPPKVLLNASAIGYYGNRGDETLTEESDTGNGFLADVCRAWENATDAAQNVGIRVAKLRFGVILSPTGGALAKMLPPFRFGVGGKIGAGTQYMSWVALDDVLGAILHVMHNDTFNGPVNIVAPKAVTNREFTKTLGRVLWRPTLFRVPRFAARLKFGEMADELLLSSARVIPQSLQQTGFSFAYPNLEPALRHMLGRWHNDLSKHRRSPDRLGPH